MQNEESVVVFFGINVNFHSVFQSLALLVLVNIVQQYCINISLVNPFLSPKWPYLCRKELCCTNTHAHIVLFDLIHFYIVP